MKKFCSTCKHFYQFPGKTAPGTPIGGQCRAESPKIFANCFLVPEEAKHAVMAAPSPGGPRNVVEHWSRFTAFPEVVADAWCSKHEPELNS